MAILIGIELIIVIIILQNIDKNLVTFFRTMDKDRGEEE